MPEGYTGYTTGNIKYQEVKEELIERQRKGQVVIMCTVVERFTNEGMQQSIQQSQKQIVINMQNKCCDINTISNLTGIQLETIKEVFKLALNY